MRLHWFNIALIIGLFMTFVYFASSTLTWGLVLVAVVMAMLFVASIFIVKFSQFKMGGFGTELFFGVVVGGVITSIYLWIFPVYGYARSNSELGLFSTELLFVAFYVLAGIFSLIWFIVNMSKKNYAMNRLKLDLKMIGLAVVLVIILALLASALSYNVARNEGEPKCYIHVFDGQKDKCFWRVAADLDDDSYCHKIVNEASKENCFDYVSSWGEPISYAGDL